MKRSIAWILAVLLVMSVTGAAFAADGDAAEPVYGGTAVLYYTEFSTVFDPGMVEQDTYALWLEPLFAMDWGADDDTLFKNNNFTLDTAQGQIAKDWSWDPEACDFTVTIRDDVFFQEKEPEYDIFHARNVTASDVKYSYDRVMGTGSGFDADNFIDVDGDLRVRLMPDFDPNYSASGEPSEEVAAPERDYIEVIDDYTLVFHMGTASEIALTDFIICPINITGPEWDTLTTDQKLDWHYACGTGPFVLTDYVADNHYTFSKNENYYGYDERHPENKLPYLDTIIIQKYSDSTSVLSDFFAGRLDYVSQNAYLSDSEIAQLTANADVQHFTYPYQASGIGLKCNQEPFSDIRVRIAMQKAINLEEVAKAYYGYDELTYPGLWDMGQAGWSAVPDWDEETLNEYTYDPEAARALLAEAGYPDGFSFTVGIDTIADPDLYELCKDYLAAVGINMEIQKLADMSEGRQIQSNPDDPRMFNMNLASGTDAGFAFQTYATTGFAYCFYNYDEEFDSLLLATRDAMTPAEQAEMARTTDLYFSRLHIIIALSGPVQTSEFFSARIGGVENGELMSASHFFRTMTARIWANN